jgi:hypothetical protein
MNFRLVCQARENHPHGVYSGTDRKYVLQCRQSDQERWQTVPIADWDELPRQEQDDIASDLRSALGKAGDV